MPAAAQDGGQPEDRPGEAGADTPLLQPSDGDPSGLRVLVEGGGGDEWQPLSPRSPTASLASLSRLGSTHWLMTTLIMLGDQFGLGTLSLPSDFARLGWLPAALCLGGFTLGSAYAGTLYQRLTLAVPRAMVFDEIGHAALGRLGSGLVFSTIYLTILCQPVILHLTCMEALRQTLYALNLSQATAFWAVTALIFPLSQVHRLEDVALVSVFGTLGMLAAVAVVVGKLLALSLARPSPAPTELVARGGLQSALVGCMDIAFAFGGQINYLRYITTMRDRRRFAAAVSITTGVMSAVYAVVSVAGYRALGTDIDLHRPISSLVGQDAWTVVMNGGIFLHCLISYQINVNVWASLLLHLTLPTKYAEQLGRADSWAKRGVWCGLTALAIASGGLVAVALPFFNLVMSLIAALGDVMSMFGLPCLFALYLLRLSRAEAALCWGLLGLAVALSGFGVVSSVQQLVQAARGGGGG